MAAAQRRATSQISTSMYRYRVYPATQELAQTFNLNLQATHFVDCVNHSLVGTHRTSIHRRPRSDHSQSLGCMGLPWQEAIDRITAILQDDRRGLEVFSLTCKAMFTSTRHLIRQTFDLTWENDWQRTLTPATGFTPSRFTHTTSAHRVSVDGLEELS